MRFKCLCISFLFDYSILGMHLFGCKFSQKMENGDTIPDRKNFDSLLWAIVTVFQVRTETILAVTFNEQNRHLFFIL